MIVSLAVKVGAKNLVSPHLPQKLSPLHFHTNSRHKTEIKGKNKKAIY